MSTSSMSKRIKRRYIYFAMIVIAAFSFLMWGLVDLQILRGEEFISSASSQSIKTIKLTGKRGMITDAESVILAQSKEVFNVTFQRDSSQNSKAQFLEFSRSILDTITIVEKYGGKISVSFVIERDPEKGIWAFNFGDVSESAKKTRQTQWRKNHYLDAKTYDEPEACISRLYARYRLDVIDEELKKKNSTGLDEATMLKIMAVYSEMQMNIFNSTPVVIAKDVSFSAVSEIEGRKMVLFGMDIAIGYKRVYPRKTLASQLIGYTGPITSQTAYDNELKPLGYSLNDEVGKDGIESSMENWLTACIRARQGGRVMEKDSLGKLTREISYTEPQDGNNVKLTIIASYQQQAERAIAHNVANTRSIQEAKIVNPTWLELNKEKIDFRDWEKYPLKLANTGVLMVVDISNGKVLALAQYPTYDLNALVAGGNEAAEILKDPRNILMNYAIQTRAEPGSIFKMVTSLAALTNGAITPATTINDEGSFMKYTNKEEDAPVCWITKAQRYKHQNQTIIQGLSNSCNYFFYTLGSLLYGDTGTNRLYKYAAEMGLTSKTGIDLPGELRSVVGTQQTLYDTTASLAEQMTSVPTLVAASIKKHLLTVGASYGITYDNERLNKCIKRLMDMAISTPSGDWADAMRPILMTELNMTREMVWLQAVVGDIWIYLNDIKWGGSMEIQMAIGQSITLLTPAAVSRYVASLANGGIVYNLMIVNSIISPEGEILSQRQPGIFNELEGVEQFLPYIKEGMRGVVDESGTAAKYFKNWKYQDQIWAKTGTSQVTVGGVKIDLENNAWFLALAPYENPEIAVVSFIPNGLSGGEASLAAKEFIEWWMDDKNKHTDEVIVVPGNQLMP